MPTGDFAKWTRRFEDERTYRDAQDDPDWRQGATLHPAVWAGIQRFQVGEDGDGANLVGKADPARALERRALTADVAGRILSDEQRHVPFHCERLHASLTELPRAMRRPVMALWRLLLLAVSPAVAADHGPALRRLDIGRRRFPMS